MPHCRDQQGDQHYKRQPSHKRIRAKEIQSENVRLERSMPDILYYAACLCGNASFFSGRVLAGNTCQPHLMLD
jgi:hypothetical protein